MRSWICKHDKHEKIINVLITYIINYIGVIIEMRELHTEFLTHLHKTPQRDRRDLVDILKTT